MNSPWTSLVALLLFLLASGFGAFVRPKLNERHRTRETIELLQVTVTMLVTFAAIVLGLLITSAKNSFDTVEADVRSYSVALMQLDQALVAAGPPGLPIRENLARYTAAAIASTWTGEAPPEGNYYPRSLAKSPTDLAEESSSLRAVLAMVQASIRDLADTTVAQRDIQAECQRQMDRVFKLRWALIEASQGSLSVPFFIVLVFWLSVIFLCFGLSCPVNPLSIVITSLSGVALTSALFVVIDLNTLFDNGFFTISSQSLRAALTEMPHPAAQLATK
ncbi:hypothetical protein [Rhodopila sp.]|uniref:bestrophin-like domain n=1 Tax=Rhodopila sp. TaxID=2480087 RepID=UPI003D0CD8EF